MCINTGPKQGGVEAIDEDGIKWHHLQPGMWSVSQSGYCVRGVFSTFSTETQ